MHWLLTLALAIVAPVGAGAATARSQPSLVAFAAVSLSNALQEASDAYTRKTGQKVVLSFAASSTLARQIEAGSPADVFISADEGWMDYLEKRHLIDSASRHDLLRNRLVLIAPADSAVELDIEPGFALAAALHKGRLAIGDPESVPAGRYAREALVSLGAWSSVADRLAPAENVRSALMFVARREAPLGIVYETDALSEKAVRVVGMFPASSHRPIVYPIASTPAAKPGTVQFIEFLRGTEGQEIFACHGFKTHP